MKSKLIIFLFLLIPSPNSELFAQGKVDLSGIFFDGITGEELPTKIFGVVEGEAFEIGSSDTSNRFNFLLNTNIQEVEFHSEGYPTVKLPVFFHGSFEKCGRAEISIQTFKRKSRFRTEDLLIFCYPLDYREDKMYDWHVLDSTGYSIRFSFGSSYKIDSNGISLKRGSELLSQGKLEIKDSLQFTDSRIYKTSAGLNFIDTYTYYKCDDLTFSQDSISLRKKVFLDKNDNQITEQGKIYLDSLSNYLLQHPKSKIAIIGLFDTYGVNNGQLISAIYRAKVVGNYLKINGFSDNRIKLFWELEKNSVGFGDTTVPKELINHLKVEVLVLNSL